MIKAVLKYNGGKRTLHQICHFGRRFGVTVMSKEVLTQNHREHTLHQKCRFGSRRE